MDTVWVLRDIGVEYDQCCAACGQGGQPELVTACEGCVERADDRWSVVGVIGEPEIRRRPEPVTGAVTRIALPEVPLDITPLGDLPGQWLLLAARGTWSAGTPRPARSPAGGGSGCPAPARTARAASPPGTGCTPHPARSSP